MSAKPRSRRNRPTCNRLYSPLGLSQLRLVAVLDCLLAAILRIVDYLENWAGKQKPDLAHVAVLVVQETADVSNAITPFVFKAVFINVCSQVY